MKAIGNEGLVEISEKLGNNRAYAKTEIGYAKSKDEIEFFEGVVHGKIVSATGESGFGWDTIFLPDGQKKTFAEMSTDEKNEISMRKIAAVKLKLYLDKQPL